MLSCARCHQGERNGQTARSADHDSMKFYAIILFFPREIIAFLTQFIGNSCLPRTGSFCQDDRTVCLAGQKMPDSWTAWGTTPVDVFCVLVYCLLLKFLLTNAPWIYCYTLFVTELGTEIVALTLRYCFDCATIVAYSAIELYEICFPHTYILCSLALFFYLSLTLDSHCHWLLIQQQP